MAARYKRSALGNVTALAALARHHLPELGDRADGLCAQAVMVTGAVWTHARPSAAMLAAYEADPSLAALRMDFAATLEEMLATLIAGTLLRSDRVMRKPVPVPWICPPQGGRPPKHCGEFVFGDPVTWGEAAAVTSTTTERYGTTTAQAWDRLHPRRVGEPRRAVADHRRGTVIRLTVAKLPSGGVNKPVWLWWSGTGATPADVDRCWQAFLRRFDVEHTFRLLKQTLGWTRPRIRDSAAADRWTWLVLAAHAQLRLARPLTADLRRPWERPAEPNRLTPARVRRGSGTCT